MLRTFYYDVVTAVCQLLINEYVMLCYVNSVKLCVSLQFSCAFRVSGSDEEYVASLSSYFVGIWISAVSISTAYCNFVDVDFFTYNKIFEFRNYPSSGIG